MTLLDAPPKDDFLAKMQKSFRDRIKCQTKYGDVECPRPAKWRAIMACCGASDFLCNQCLEVANTDPQQSVYFKPGHDDYFGCEGCSTLHPTWKSAVKEIIKL